ncbi:MAG: hypothetical protein A2498_13815 [Lentisphaerae bacterium RIFOXYC12_FULL_60_16]|nr:MAG: hypothetical protein A2498_13815 [Lentisphaerae bacterium RIFOXYC12_FULL_60_16]
MMAWFRLPEVTIDLMARRTAENDCFYRGVVDEFYRDATRPHPKLRVVGALERGVALCPLPATHMAYLAGLEPAGRRNVNKAQRLGYRFEPIDYNRYVDDIAAIRRSTEVRQGRMPESYLKGPVEPCRNPPSKTTVHDYPYFGVLKEGRLVAYAGVLVAGELGMIEHILGHAEHQADGVVPLLVSGMAGVLVGGYPSVRYYGYGTWFGAGTTLRRFKRKFGFRPYRVRWVLG